MEKISIIIPLYNKEKTIFKTVNSCLSQDYTNIEVVVVDDGSTDNSLNMIKSITDSRLVVKSFPNGGVSAARNRGAKIANGDFLIFIDADDLMLSNCVSTLVALKKKYPGADIYCGNCEVVSNGESTPFCKNKKEGFINNNFRERYFRKFTMSAGSTMYSKVSYERHGGYDIRISIFEDTDFDLRYLRFAKIVYTPKCLYKHILDNAELSVNLKPLNCYYTNYADFNDATCFWEKIIMAMIVYAIICKFKDAGKTNEYKILKKKFRRYYVYVYIHKFLSVLFR